MSGVEKFWSCDAQNLFCVRASDYDQLHADNLRLEGEVEG
jgi:hypothetical protein